MINFLERPLCFRHRTAARAERFRFAVLCCAAIIEFNVAAERVYGYSRAEVLGKQLAETVIPPSFRERHRRGMAHYRATGEGTVLGKRIELPAMPADSNR